MVRPEEVPVGYVSFILRQFDEAIRGVVFPAPDAHSLWLPWQAEGGLPAELKAAWQSLLSETTAALWPERAMNGSAAILPAFCAPGQVLTLSSLPGAYLVLPEVIPLPEKLTGTRPDEMEWARKEMRGANVRDPRRIRSLGAIVGKLARKAGESFSSAVGPDSRQAARRIYSDAAINPRDLLAGHIAQTAERCREHDVVLVAQDTTMLNYSTHVATTGLGPINDKESVKGLYLHPAYAMTEEGEPLGVLYAKLWARDPEQAGQSQSRRKRSAEDKESYKWAEGLQAVSTALPTGPTVVLIQDREGDLWSLLSAERQANMELVVRASQPRKMEVRAFGGDWKRHDKDLLSVARKAPAVGTIRIRVPRKPGQPERVAELKLRVIEIRMPSPCNIRAAERKQPQRFWLVNAVEMNPPAGEEAVDWTLITTIPTKGKRGALRILKYYTKRWVIERLNFTLKSGCHVERLQVDDAHSLMNAIALYLPVAWRFMWLTYVARTNPNMPASQLLSEDEIEVLSRVEGRRVETAHDVAVAVAKLGGFEHYRKAKQPGIKSMWKGLCRLSAMAEGWRLALTPVYPD